MSEDLATQSQENGIAAINPMNAMRWRCIGPPRGGRVVAVAGDPEDLAVFYFGACAGGVWKTTDAGTYWENVSDGFFRTSAVGAITVAESDHNVVYAGMGESCIRGDVSYGDGVYRSTDAGKTWSHLGLEDTRHIARIRVHPDNADLVYVAALGHAFGPNSQRGVFRSSDGGKSWDKVLFRDDNTGAIDLSFDPTNPRILYAALWEAQRTPWSLVSGGPGSGIFKSTDGGDSWQELTGNPGLPEGLKGRIGIAASPAKAGRVWATIEVEDAALFRSDDGGDTWEKVSDNQDIQGRPWYYQHVFADPQDADTVWVLNYQAWKSIDGGKNFQQVTTPHGDNHDLWIDPKNPRRMIEGNDGGACVSFNGGETWSTIYNQLTAQFYHVATDNRFPYRVYGTQQDNSAISVPSRTHKGAIPWGDCYTVGNSESGHIAVHAQDPDIVVSGAVGSSAGGGGNLLRYDHATGQVRIITVWPELGTGRGPKEMKYRFQWTFPVQFSPHDPDVLYVAGNLVFRSTDQGSTWEAISPDLTRGDVTKMETSGGPITKDTSGAETYGTIFAFVESPHEAGVFWAGSDDGLVHISRDAGKTWDGITPSDLPEWALVSMIEASPHDPAKAYLAATRYKLDETRPMLYKTSDYGESWTDISQGIPEGDYTRVIREDPVRRGLLYVGTETGVYVSYDDGGSWAPLRGNLPTVPVYDLAVKENDLVAATHGRSFWVLDDLTVLHQITGEMAETPVQLLQSRTSVRLRSPAASRKPSTGKQYRLSLGADVAYTEDTGPAGETVRRFLDAGENPPRGVNITYYLKDKPEEEVTLTVLDSEKQVIKTFTSAVPEDQSSDGNREPRLLAEAGVNRFVWDMRYPDARKVPGDKTTEEMTTGPVAPPGTYRLSLRVDGVEHTGEFQIVKDPRVAASQADFDSQFELHLRIRDKLSETHDTINKLRNIRRQVEEWEQRAASHSSADTVAGAAASLKEKLAAIEGELVQAGHKGARDRLNLPVQLNRKLAELVIVVASADFAPPKQAGEVFQDLSARIDTQISLLEDVVEQDVAQFVSLVEELGIPAIIPSAQPPGAATASGGADRN
ncbi:MAG: glycosyl hydrolase [Chloroflexi bacterium]|nr:glycosyl hydrolase [Chloroflexota bacterium]